MKPTEKSAQLVRALYKRTGEGVIRWVELSSDEEYQTTVAGKPIHIGELRNDYYIVLFREDGEIADRFTDVDLNQVPPELEGFGSMYQLMEALFEMAKRQASGADAVINDILNELR